MARTVNDADVEAIFEVYVAMPPPRPLPDLLALLAQNGAVGLGLKGPGLRTLQRWCDEYHWRDRAAERDRERRQAILDRLREEQDEAFVKHLQTAAARKRQRIEELDYWHMLLLSALTVEEARVDGNGDPVMEVGPDGAVRPTVVRRFATWEDRKPYEWRCLAQLLELIQRMELRELPDVETALGAAEIPSAPSREHVLKVVEGVASVVQRVNERQKRDGTKADRDQGRAC